MNQQEIMDRILTLAREIEPLQKEINDLAIIETNLPERLQDKDMSESIQSWRTYD